MTTAMWSLRTITFFEWSVYFLGPKGTDWEGARVRCYWNGIDKPPLSRPSLPWDVSHTAMTVRRALCISFLTLEEEYRFFILFYFILSMPPLIPNLQGVFKCKLGFPPNYSFEPPTMRFCSGFWHPNVYKDGKVCIFYPTHARSDEPRGERTVRGA